MPRFLAHATYCLRCLLFGINVQSDTCLHEEAHALGVDLPLSKQSGRSPWSCRLILGLLVHLFSPGSDNHLPFLHATSATVCLAFEQLRQGCLVIRRRKPTRAVVGGYLWREWRLPLFVPAWRSQLLGLLLVAG